MSAVPQTAPSAHSFWPLSLRIALRDLRGGLRGFGILLACLALGVAAITGVGSLARSLADGLAQQGRVILGGDVSFDVIQRELSPDERAYIAARGRLSEIVLMRAIARAQSGEATLVEIKAADSQYPALGALDLSPAAPLADILAEKDGAFGVAADPAVLARLDLHVGDTIEIGSQRFSIRSALGSEPDKLAIGVAFGPRVLMSKAGLAATGLDQPGALVRHLYRVSLNEPGGRLVSDAGVQAFVADAQKAFPTAGWEARTRLNVSPSFSRDLERFSQFLTLVGLTALIIGGVGVANAIRGYVERQRATIATLKSLGATGARVFWMMLTEIMLIAAIGMAIGTVIGIALPFGAAAALGALLPFPVAPSVYPAEIAKGLLYGVLTALAFSLTPLGRAHDLPVAALFRDHVARESQRLRKRYIAMASAAALGLIGTILLFSADRRLALYYMGATLAAFALLFVIARLVMLVARLVPRPRNVALRLAVANIHRPGALTPSVVLSLGLGLALLVALTLVDGNIRGELGHRMPGQTPSFFFLDVRNDLVPAFKDFLERRAPDAKLVFVPMLRGRIVAVKDVPVGQIKPSETAAWVLQGDRGITFDDAVPDGSKLVAGQWWAKDYSGPPLVSLESDIAAGLGLALGDKISVNVLGRTLTATVANTRQVNWRTYGINFVLVFSPNTFAGAPYGDLATVTFAKSGDDPRELTLMRDVARDYPAITSLRVKDALDAVASVVEQLAIAIRAASSVALLAAVLVLAGALAAGQQARLYDAVVLKTLGATRGRLMLAFMLEFGLLGLATAVFGVAAGAAAAYGVVEGIMKLDFIWLWPQALVAALIALVATIGLGLAGTWRILGRKPASYLRSL